MKITVKTTPKQAAQFRDMRSRLDSLGKKGRKKIAAHLTREHEQARLTQEIEKMEESGSLSDKAINRLCFKKEKLRLLTKRVERDSQPAGDEVNELANVLLEFRPLFNAMMGQVNRQLTAQMLNAVKPFYSSQTLGEGLFARSDALLSFGSFASRQWGLEGAPLVQARDAIVIIDLFLAGRSPWQLEKY